MLCHYVPRFYLARFVDASRTAGGRLWQADLKQADPGPGLDRARRVKQRVPASKAATLEDYYSLSNENAFHQIESDAARVIRLIDDGRRVLASAERLAMARLIVSLLPRVPYYRTRNEAEIRGHVGVHLEADAHGNAREIDPDTVPDYFLDLAMGEAEPLIGLIHDMGWVYVEAGEGEFLTSDTPVHCLAPPTSPLASGHPMRNPGAEVTFPLSPRLCLTARWDRPGGDGVATADAFMRKVMNWNRIKGADYAYCASATMADWAILMRSATLWEDHRREPLPMISWLPPVSRLDGQR